MGDNATGGWPLLLRGFPWFAGKGGFPLPAYSEFMPPPRLGRSPYGEIDPTLFSEDDPFGWRVAEIEEESELRPGLDHLAQTILASLVRLGQGCPEPRLAGHRGHGLCDNPYWPPDLAAKAGALSGERFVVLLPLALSRTQDDKGRIRWTFFGASEQGPERAFWQSFRFSPGRDAAAGEAELFLVRLLSFAYGEKDLRPDGLRAAGFRILPSAPDPRFPYWTADPLPAWARPFLIDDGAPLDSVRYLLTFRAFDRLPAAVKERYFSGRLVLLPFPGSLVFWGAPGSIRLSAEFPPAMQISLQKLVPRREAPGGLRVPQSGWFHEPGSANVSPEIDPQLLLNTYRRTSRWDRVLRHVDDGAAALLEGRVARVLFSTGSEDMGLYGKPMARNGQVWTEDGRVVLDGPRATPAAITAAILDVERGGIFRYRFQFPAMRVGRHEVYWHRPLAAFWDSDKGRANVVPDAPIGFLTAYAADAPDPADAVALWPRILRREPYLAALREYEGLREHYFRQTPLNVLSILDASGLLGGRPLDRSFARALLRLAETETLEDWLDSLPERAAGRAAGERIRSELERRLAPGPADADDINPVSLTFGRTAARAFEEGWWNDVAFLSGGTYADLESADGVRDAAGRTGPGRRRRDLEALGDHLLDRHRRAIAAAGLEGRALCGEIPFRWQTDFPFELFGGWKDNQDGRTHERNLLVMIPGRNRGEAVILADHYDTAYMEDRFDPRRGGTGARVAAAGADDNHSATAAVLQAAPILLGLAGEGRLERDIWLMHLTGEEFPADSLGARHFVQSLVEGNLRMRRSHEDAQGVDLSGVRVKGIFVMDMIAHNRDAEKNVFQISPGIGAASLHLAVLAQRAAAAWNAGTDQWNRSDERRGRVRGRRSPDGLTIPETALHPHLRGEVRTSDDPRSTLFNTDGQIFSDAGIPVVLFMENYDISRSGYHDSQDTMANIDLDFGAAVAAVAVETVAAAAAARTLD